MPKAPSQKDSTPSILPEDPEHAAAVLADWEWKTAWREAMKRLPFDQKLAILNRMWKDRKAHPFRLVSKTTPQARSLKPKARLEGYKNTTG
jgi:hypothetical protein